MGAGCDTRQHRRDGGADCLNSTCPQCPYACYAFDSGSKFYFRQILPLTLIVLSQRAQARLHTPIVLLICTTYVGTDFTVNTADTFLNITPISPQIFMRDRCLAPAWNSGHRFLQELGRLCTVSNSNEYSYRYWNQLQPIPPCSESSHLLGLLQDFSFDSRSRSSHCHVLSFFFCLFMQLHSHLLLSAWISLVSKSPLVP